MSLGKKCRWKKSVPRDKKTFLGIGYLLGGSKNPAKIIKSINNYENMIDLMMFCSKFEQKRLFIFLRSLAKKQKLFGGHLESM
jgi:hypothetical protein